MIGQVIGTFINTLVAVVELLTRLLSSHEYVTESSKRPFANRFSWSKPAISKGANGSCEFCNSHAPFSVQITSVQEQLESDSAYKESRLSTSLFKKPYCYSGQICRVTVLWLNRSGFVLLSLELALELLG